MYYIIEGIGDDSVQTNFDSKHRWAELKEFISKWYKPLSSNDGLAPSRIGEAEKRLGVRIPAALREWYELAGRREELTCAQNWLLMPEDLEIEEGALVFYRENQAVATWGISLPDLELPNPPVSLKIDGEDVAGPRWIRENNMLSNFIFQMVIFETVVSSPYSEWIYAALPDPELTSERLIPFPFPSWHWPIFPTRFFHNDNSLVVAVAGDGLWLAGRSEKALRHLHNLLNFDTS